MNELLHTPLSERELEILRLVAQGKSNKEIASELFISINTVKVHLAKIFQRIGVVSRTEATLYAIKNGITQITEKMDSSNVVPLNLGEKYIISTYTKNGVQQTENRYPPIIFLTIILLLTISVFVLLQRNLSIQVDNTLSDWQKLRDLPSIHFKPAVAVIDSQIYVIGGETQTGTSSQTDLFDPNTNTWKTLADKPTPVSHAKAVSISGRIYVPGGRGDNGKATDVMEMFNPATNKWERMSDLPKPLDNYGLSYFSDNIYLFGGQDQQIKSKIIYVYNTKENTWSELAMINSSGIVEMGVVHQNNRFLLFGGTDGSEHYLHVYSFDPEINSSMHDPWTQIATLPLDVKPDSVQLVGDFIFLLGSKGIWQFVPQNGEWILQSYQGKPPHTTEDTIISTDGYLFKLGGYNTKGGFSNEFFRYQVIYSVVLPNIYK